MANKITTTKNHIIFDVDSTTVGGGLFRFEYDDKNKIVATTELFVTRQQITNGKEYPFEKFFIQTLQTLKSVAETVHLHSMITIDGIYCNVSTPWVSAQKRIIGYSSKKEFIFTADLVDELIEKDTDSSLVKNINYSGHDVELIGRHTVGVYGNGYKLRQPLGKKMVDLKMHSLTSVMSTSTKKSFSDVIEKVFHRETEYLSNTLVSYQNVKKMSPDNDNVIIIDISGEVTEVLVVKNDNLKHIGSIPVGTYGILRHLRDTLSVPYEKARHLLELHHNKNLDSDYSNNIASDLHDAFRTWFKPFFNLCDEYAKEGLLPSTILLRSDRSISTWLEYMILQEEGLREHIHTTGRIVLEHMDVTIPEKHTDAELAIVSTFIA